jgi:hypothetical protein
LYISRDGYAQEYEIKVTHRDFLADAIKQQKHSTMANGGGPSQFWYVCPPDVISQSELPDHAGLLYTYPMRGGRFSNEPDGAMSLWIIKRAPRRKVSPIPERRWREIATKSVDRYWSIRLEMIRRVQRAEKMKTGTEPQDYNEGEVWRERK